MTVRLRKTLTALAVAVANEARRNQAFRAALERALGLEAEGPETPPAGPRKRASMRAGKRRTPAVLDPVALARNGESELRSRLTGLELEQLRDIIAEYGMDPSKLAMKWKTVSKVIDQIVKLSLSRAAKGDVFLSS